MDSEQFNTEDKRGAFYRSSRWDRVRREALKRDNHECQQCKREGRMTLDSEKVQGEKKKPRLNVDHIQELQDRPDLALELDNLETLCIKCHNKKHNRYQAQPAKWPDEWY